MDRLSDLNSAQREAVRTTEGPLLILAGAGTGKTRVITRRMAELIRNGAAPERILSVTFTNKAAREMLERTLSLLGSRRRGERRQRPLICTFHSFCVRILRSDAPALGYPADFAIYDRGDQESVARSALRDIRVGDTSLRPGDLLNVISRWKMANVPPQRATEFVENDLEFLAAVAYRKYQSKLRASGAVDFDDLLMLTNELFRQHPEILTRHQQRFDFVQIDEYQDTNGAQFELVEAMVRPHHNLCVVGDDDQSIYGWRGADITHILSFQKHFPEAKVIRLEANYRCTDRILDLANRLVRHNRGRHEKTLVAKRQSNQPVRFFEFPDETAEAQGVVREIREAILNQGVSPENIAILFRTNEQPRVFESELRRVGVRYTLIGSQSFFDRREIRDLMAYLKVLAHPEDEVSLLRIINTPARGIGTSTVQALLEQAVKRGCSLWDVIPDLAAGGKLASRTVVALDGFRRLLEDLRHRFEQTPEQLAENAKWLIDTVGYRKEVERQYKDPNQQNIRWNSVEQLVDAVAAYVQVAVEPSLAGFLEDTALLGRDEESDKDDQLEERAIKLMTLHSAKGLEFPHVYLVGMEEGLLPHHRSVEADGAAIEEERRLAYVGITRAMDHLTLSLAASRMKWGKRRPSIPSRFLWEMRGELPPEELEFEYAPNGAV